MQATVTKQALRRQYRALRDALPQEKKREADRKICRLILTHPAFQKAGTVLLYMPCGSEIDILPVAEEALRLGKTVAFPRTGAAHTMTFRTVGALSELTPGAYGIPEPPASAPGVTVGADTFLLVPGLCFDRDGYRIGYGGGYYDRFLSAEGSDALTVGACYDSLLCHTPLPRGKFDLPVRILITEKGVIPTHG